jgi:NADH-quinone oxidoreductase subunit F
LWDNAARAEKEPVGWKKILHKILDGQGTLADIDLLWDIQSKIEGKTICALGDAAAWPVASAIRHFRPEFEAYIKDPIAIRKFSHYNEKYKIAESAV